MEEQIQQLQQQLAQRDEALNTLKVKTKDFVSKMKGDHQQELDSVRKTSAEAQSKVSELEAKLQAAEQQSSSRVHALEQEVAANREAASKLAEITATLAAANASIAVKDDQLREKEAQCSSAAGQLSALEDRLKAAEGDRDAAVAKAVELESTIAKTAAQIVALQAAAVEHEAKVKALEADHAEQLQEINRRSDQASVSAMAELTAQTAALNAQLTEKDAILSQLQTTGAGSSAATDALIAQVGDLQAKLAAAIASDEERDGKVKSLELKLLEVENSKQAASNALVEMSSQRDALQLALDAESLASATATSTASDLTAQIADLQAQRSVQQAEHLLQLQALEESKQATAIELTLAQTQVTLLTASLQDKDTKPTATAEGKQQDNFSLDVDLVEVRKLHDTQKLSMDAEDKADEVSKAIATTLPEEEDKDEEVLRGQLLAVQAERDELLNRLEAVNGAAVEHGAAIKALKAGHAEQLQEMERQSKQAIADVMAELTAQTAALNAQLTEKDAILIQLQTAGAGSSAATEALMVQVGDLQAKLTAAAAAGVEREGKLESLELKLLEVENSKQAVGSDLFQAQSNVTALTAALSGKEEQLAAMCEQLSSLEEKLQAVTSERDHAQSALDKQKTAHEVEVADLQEKLAASSAVALEHLSTLQALRTAHAAQLDALEQAKQLIMSELSEMTANVSALKTEKDSLLVELQDAQATLAAERTASSAGSSATEVLTTQVAEQQKELAAAAADYATKIQTLEAALVQQIESMEEFKKTVTDDMTNAREKVATLSGEVTQKDLLLAQSQQQMQALEEKNKQLTDTVEKAKVGYRKMQSEKVDLQKQLQALEEENEKLLGEYSTNVVTSAEQISAMTTERDGLKAKLLDSERAVAQLQEDKLSLQNVHLQQISAVQQEKDSISSALAALEARSQLQSGQEASDAIALRADLEAKTGLISRLQAECAELEDKVHKLDDEKKSLEAQRKEMQLHIDDIMASLHTKDSQSATLQKTHDDKEKALRQQLTTVTNQSKQKIQELSLTADNLKAEVVQLTASLENCKSLLNNLTKERSDLKENVERLQSKLDQEVQQNQDRKKKVKSYLDKVHEEQTALLATKNTLEITLHDNNAEKLMLQGRLVEMENALRAHIDMLKQDMETQVADLNGQIARLQSLISDKDLEITSLTYQVELASQHSMEEVNATRLKIQESLQELEAHKSKRLTARNEMINLAKALERAQAEGSEVKSTVQYGLTPIVFEQITSIETLVRNVEQVAYLLTSPNNAHKKAAAMSPTAHSAHSAHSSTPLHSSGKGDFIDFDAGAQLPTSKQVPALNGLNAISEALQLVEGLKHDLDRQQMGLTLLALSVSKLQDIVSPANAPSSFLGNLLSCCHGNVYDILSSATSTSSEGFAHVHRDISGSYTAQGGQGTSPLHESQSAASKRRGRGLLLAGGKKGYQHLDANNMSGLFTVGEEEEDELG